MRTKTVFVFLDNTGLEAHATIDVPGLGEVKIIHALSTELCERIHAEAIVALKHRMGNPVSIEEPTI